MKVSSGQFDVIVMGAGMAGLTAGRFLTKTSYSVQSIPVRRITFRKIPISIKKKIQHFSKAAVKLVFSASSVTWNRWVYRMKGRVGGIPQSMKRFLFDWIPAESPFKGLCLCNDPVFLEQGIPGVTLSGINVYLRVKKTFNYSKVH